MNAFANSMMSILLSWIRSLFSGLLSMLQDGSGNIFSWIGGHWIPLSVFLIIFGLLADFIIYMIRWRPQNIWKAYWRHVFHSDDDPFDDDQFDEGFNDAIPGYDFTDAPIAGLDISPLNSPQSGESLYADMTDRPKTAEEITRSSSGAADPSASQDPEGRHRRSSRHSKSRVFLFSGKNRIPILDTKKPDAPIDPRSAFHDAVYPSSDASHSSDTDNKDPDNE